MDFVLINGQPIDMYSSLTIWMYNVLDSWSKLDFFYSPTVYTITKYFTIIPKFALHVKEHERDWETKNVVFLLKSTRN